MNFGPPFHVLSALALDVILPLLVESLQFSKSEVIVLVVLLTSTTRTLNRLGFGMLKPLEQLCFDCDCFVHSSSHDR